MSAAIGFFVGCVFMRVLFSLPFLMRPCCRAHYLTHPPEEDWDGSNRK